ncbi:hypothetical protein GCM10027160_52130 [Streptomyces calidiresistens]|uniref:Uncharacterized protein n=1 Tax=Streptomyces calidiresistens TaxID=1485586 RepID=A0A7W3T7A1_9ACTN|nr:hypothetical protein [Streptomyces calidiresistens]MBB0232021.1 hypothetical protein [Streptomyces calidiresistens]
MPTTDTATDTPTTGPVLAPEAIELQAVHYGTPVICLGEDGDVLLAVTSDVRRAVAAWSRMQRYDSGERLAVWAGLVPPPCPFDPECGCDQEEWEPLPAPTVEHQHVVFLGPPPGAGPDEDYEFYRPATADTPGAIRVVVATR